MVLRLMLHLGRGTTAQCMATSVSLRSGFVESWNVTRVGEWNMGSSCGWGNMAPTWLWAEWAARSGKVGVIVLQWHRLPVVLCSAVWVRCEQCPTLTSVDGWLSPPKPSNAAHVERTVPSAALSFQVQPQPRDSGWGGEAAVEPRSEPLHFRLTASAPISCMRCAASATTDLPRRAHADRDSHTYFSGCHHPLISLLHTHTRTHSHHRLRNALLTHSHVSTPPP